MATMTDVLALVDAAGAIDLVLDADVAGVDIDWDALGADATPAAVSPSTPPTPPPPSNGDRNRTRRRQREELLHLRQRVAELEAQRDALLTQLQPAITSHSPVSVTDQVQDQTTSASASASKWHAIAERQRQQRDDAVVANHKLRAAVDAQLRLAKTLAKLLSKRPHAGVEDDDSLGIKRQCLMVDAVNDDDAAVFRRLLTQAEQSFRELDSVVAATTLDQLRDGTQRTQLCARAESNELLVDFVDVTVLPFSFATTTRAAWRCLTLGQVQMERSVVTPMVLPASDDVVALRLRHGFQRRRTTVMLDSRFLMKQFVHAHEQRVVQMWESQAVRVAQESLNDHGPGSVQVRERGWVVFTPSGANATRMATYAQIIPQVHETAVASASHERDVGLLTDLVLHCCADKMSMTHQAIENLALEEVVSEQ